MHDKCRMRSEIDGKTTTMEFHSDSKEKKDDVRNKHQLFILLLPYLIAREKNEEARAREREREKIFPFFLSPRLSDDNSIITL